MKYVKNPSVEEVKRNSKELRNKILSLCFKTGPHNPYTIVHALNTSLLLSVKMTTEIGSQKDFLELCIKSLESMKNNLDQVEDKEKDQFRIEKDD